MSTRRTKVKDDAKIDGHESDTESVKVSSIHSNDFAFSALKGGKDDPARSAGRGRAKRARIHTGVQGRASEAANVSTSPA